MYKFDVFIVQMKIKLVGKSDDRQRILVPGRNGLSLPVNSFLLHPFTHYVVRDDGNAHPLEVFVAA